jgi:hypothetical protein
MALEFRTRDENYKGHGILPSGTRVWRAKVFVDHLPPQFITTPYNPYLVNDKYSHRSRYVIDSHILVNQDTFLLVSVSLQGTDSTDSEEIQLVRVSVHLPGSGREQRRCCASRHRGSSLCLHR